MMLSLKQTNALSQLAGHLYDYLPGSGAPYTFAHAAAESGVGDFWPGGSKLPALNQLLEATLSARSASFCDLVLRIVSNGIKYRAKKGNPLSRAEVQTLNDLVKGVGFKIPELWDSEFLESLPGPLVPPTQPAVQGPETFGPDGSHNLRLDVERDAAVAQLLQEFLCLRSQADRNAAGLSLERLLNRLFSAYGFDPSAAFKVVGEQIDGSFLLDSQVYLLEAKWTASPISEAELLVFRGKIEAKSSFTRGLFVSVNGFSGPALEAITAGKQPTFFMMDGAHLYRVLDGSVRLDELLRRMVRLLAETGRPFVPISELF